MPPQRGGCSWLITVAVADSPGVLTSVAQVLSTLQVHVQRFRFESNSKGCAAIEILLDCEETKTDLLCRKFGRLIDVLAVDWADGAATAFPNSTVNETPCL